MLGNFKRAQFCLRNLTWTCLEEAPVLLPFVRNSVDALDNGYVVAMLKWYNREIHQVGEVTFIPTEVALVVDAGLRQHVKRFATDPVAFEKTFARAYFKLEDSTATTKDRS